MKPKTTETANPSKYRPISCLITIYKIYTECIAEKVRKHCEENRILAEEQKGCRKGARGCKEQIIIDQVIMEQVCKKTRNITTAFIDYQKVSTSLNENTECGFKIKITEKRSQAITHLLYMDDLKLYGQTEEKLHKLVKITKEFSEKIHMNFGLDKCSNQNIRRGKMEPQMKEKNELPIMSAEDVYK